MPTGNSQANAVADVSPAGEFFFIRNTTQLFVETTFTAPRLIAIVNWTSPARAATSTATSGR
jgi:hypothetical protein